MDDNAPKILALCLGKLTPEELEIIKARAKEDMAEFSREMERVFDER